MDSIFWKLLIFFLVFGITFRYILSFLKWKTTNGNLFNFLFETTYIRQIEINPQKYHSNFVKGFYYLKDEYLKIKSKRIMILVFYIIIFLIFAVGYIAISALTLEDTNANSISYSAFLGSIIFFVILLLRYFINIDSMILAHRNVNKAIKKQENLILEKGFDDNVEVFDKKYINNGFQPINYIVPFQISFKYLIYIFNVKKLKKRFKDEQKCYYIYFFFIANMHLNKSNVYDRYYRGLYQDLANFFNK
ncbi:hypothetical protein BCF59_0151 [Mycoplasmopsis mustelae]|uniref:Uncharacterized protein n=1 Tax=Mycoplasmopsis mustelae TaxID=171289 RepID=A0A4R7UE45_9BACT|nr:hypothetical protein [Mycoplasmopsis mustelae]TDV24201.1 hypothetical protein BCF59_0151 [Mycoplasmopsis mustelae]